MLLRHAQWDLPEAVVIVVLLALGVLVVAGVVAGLVQGIGNSHSVSSDQSSASALLVATSWAIPAYAFVALVAIGLVWWEVHTAIAVVDGALAQDDAPHGPDGASDQFGDGDDRPVLAAFDHLLRARRLATLTVPVLMAFVLGALAAVVGSFLADDGVSNRVQGTTVPGHALALGSGAAVWVLAGAALVVALYLRTQVAREFARAEHAADRERVLDEGVGAGDGGGGA